jgi:hypothetical protein
MTPSDDAEAQAAELRADVTKRLKAVCSDWPADVFDAMVAGVVAVTLKYDVGSQSHQYDRRSLDRLVGEMKDLADRAARARGQ